MACFSVGWLVQMLVMAAIAAGIYMIVTLLLAKIALGEPFVTAVQIVKIVMWVIFAVMIIYFIADLISCAFGSGPIGFPRVR